MKAFESLKQKKSTKIQQRSKYQDSNQTQRMVINKLPKVCQRLFPKKELLPIGSFPTTSLFFVYECLKPKDAIPPYPTESNKKHCQKLDLARYQYVSFVLILDASASSQHHDQTYHYQSTLSYHTSSNLILFLRSKGSD